MYYLFSINCCTSLTGTRRIPEGQMDGWTDRWMDGHTDGRMDRQMDGWTDRWMDGQTDGWMDRQTDGQMSCLFSVNCCTSLTGTRRILEGHWAVVGAKHPVRSTAVVLRFRPRQRQVGQTLHGAPRPRGNRCARLSARHRPHRLGARHPWRENNINARHT